MNADASLDFTKLKTSVKVGHLIIKRLIFQINDN